MKRYCYLGNPLLVDYVAHFLMGRDIHARRIQLSRMESTDSGLVDDVKERMIEIHDQMKDDEQE